MPVSAGQVIPASELTGPLTVVGRQTTDSAAVVSSTVLVNTQIIIALSANTTYGFHGYFIYSSDNSADCKFGWTVPASATGRWSLFCADPTNTPVAGLERINYTDFNAELLSTTMTAAGDDASLAAAPLMAARPSGFITTAGTAGNLTLQFAQGTSFAANTIFRAGSWLACVKLA